MNSSSMPANSMGDSEDGQGYFSLRIGLVTPMFAPKAQQEGSPHVQRLESSQSIAALRKERQNVSPRLQRGHLLLPIPDVARAGYPLNAASRLTQKFSNS